ncbi:MAG: hypothetical protein JWP81_1082 [Ferruginibacter sp.]|nr:hypothetical protein [Ferruginibacter sp.]
MERNYVESSMISSFGYAVEISTLEIEFKKSGAIWQYFDVPESTYFEMCSCESCGKFFLASIKGQFPESQVG